MPTPSASPDLRALDAVRAFLSGMPAEWPDDAPISMQVPDGFDEPPGDDDPSPLTLGHLRSLAALRSGPARAIAKGDPELAELLRRSAEAVKNMSPEEREEMFRKQRESWVRGESGMAETSVALRSPSVEPAGVVAEIAAELRSLFDKAGHLSCSGEYQLEVIAKADRVLAAPSATQDVSALVEAPPHPHLTTFLRQLWRGAEIYRLSVEDDFRDLYDAALSGTLSARQLAQLATDEVRHSTDNPVDGLEALFKALLADIPGTGEG